MKRSNAEQPRRLKLAHLGQVLHPGPIMKVNHLKNFETLLMNMSLLILRGWKRLKFGCIDQAAMSPVHGSLAKDVLGARIPKSTG
jgi:hypothetical protein